MKYFALAITITTLYIAAQELALPPTSILFQPDISQHIIKHLPPNNVFLNSYQEKLPITPAALAIMRRKYIEAHAQVLWRIFHDAIEPICLNHYQEQIPLASAINIDQTIIAIAYENAIVIYDIESQETTRRLTCATRPTKLVFLAENLFVSYIDGTLDCIDIMHDSSKSLKLSDHNITHMIIVGRYIYSTDTLNTIIQIDTQTLTTQTHTTNLQGITALSELAENLIIGLYNGTLYKYHTKTKTLEQLAFTSNCPIIHINSNNNAISIKTAAASYTYNTETQTYNATTLHPSTSMPICSLTHEHLKLFKQYDLITEPFPQLKPILPEMFYIGTTSLVSISSTICMISDTQKTILLNLEKILKPLSFQELKLICQLEKEYQNHYTLFIAIQYLLHLCRKKQITLLNQKKWAAIFLSLPIFYQNFIRNRYKITRQLFDAKLT